MVVMTGATAEWVPEESVFEEGHGVYVRPTPGIEQRFGSLLASGGVPFNLEPAGVATVPFDSAVAEGRFAIHFRGLPSTPKAVFEGKQRQCFAAVQARFKRPVAFRDLVAGTEFRRALRLPQSRVVNAAAAWIAAKVGAGDVNTLGEQPYMRAPAVLFAQQIHVARPGEEPRELLAVEEDMRLHDPSLACPKKGQPWSSAQRRAFFSSPRNLEGREFLPGLVYTFSFYDATMSYATYQLNMPLLPLDMARILRGQPVQLMLRDDAARETALSLEFWNRRLREHSGAS